MPEAPSSQPVEVFYAYARKDERLRQNLEAHLSLLRQQGLIIGWHDRDISAGTEWDHEIDMHLNKAQIILLLVSSDFLASDYCYSVEMKRALERHQAGEAYVIPVLLRSVDWHEAPFKHLQVLPSTSKPVTDRTWHTRDEAFTDVARGIRKVIEGLTMMQSKTTVMPGAPLPTPSQEPGVNDPAPGQSEDIRVRVPKQVVSSLPDIPTTRQKSGTLNIPYVSDLIEALQRRTLVLFIGNDLPHTIAGLPSRMDMARVLARRHGLDESLSLAEVAQRVSQAGNRFTFTAFIRDALDITDKSPQPFHRHIALLVQTYQIETLISTTYDRLLEAAFQEAGNSYNCLISGNDVAFVRFNRPTLIKLYGDIQQPDTLVITERDHSDLLRRRDKEPLLDEVRRAFRRNSVLFLGYNFSDPDFRLLFDYVAQGTFAHMAYAVWSELTAADVQMWRDRGLTIIDAHPLDVLESIRR